MLNNENPSLYNVDFWSRHFSIPIPAVRNIFNYLAYPIIDIKTKEVTGYMTFIDEELEKNVKLIADMT